MTLQTELLASPVDSVRDRRSFVRLLMGGSLALSALSLGACAPEGYNPHQDRPRYGGNGNDRGDRGGGVR